MAHPTTTAPARRQSGQLLLRQILMMPDHQAVSQGTGEKPKMQKVWAVARLEVNASLYSLGSLMDTY